MLYCGWCVSKRGSPRRFDVSSASASRGAHRRSDGRPFAVAGDGPNEGADGRPAAKELRRPLVFAETRIAAAHGTAALWARDPELAATIDRDHENPRYLPGVDLGPVRGTADLAEACAWTEAETFDWVTA